MTETAVKIDERIDWYGILKDATWWAWFGREKSTASPELARSRYMLYLKVTIRDHWYRKQGYYD